MKTKTYHAMAVDPTKLTLCHKGQRFARVNLTKDDSRVTCANCLRIMAVRIGAIYIGNGVES